MYRILHFSIHLSKISRTHAATALPFGSVCPLWLSLAAHIYKKMLQTTQNTQYV